MNFIHFIRCFCEVWGAYPPPAKVRFWVCGYSEPSLAVLMGSSTYLDYLHRHVTPAAVLGVGSWDPPETYPRASTSPTTVLGVGSWDPPEIHPRASTSPITVLGVGS